MHSTASSTHGNASMVFVPILPLIRGVKLTENSIDSSLQNATRNELHRIVVWLILAIAIGRRFQQLAGTRAAA